MTMSSIGLPALNGFIGELLILQGVFVANKIWAAFAASGVVLGAAYMLWLYQRTMFGKIENPKNEHLQDLNFREFATYAPLLILAVWIGLYPKPFIDRLQTSVDRVVVRINPEYRAQALRAEPEPREPGTRNQEPGTAGSTLVPAGINLSDFYYLLPEIVLTTGALLSAARRSDGPARQAVDSGVGHAGGARRDGGRARPGGRRERSGVARADRRRSLRAVLQGDLPRSLPRSRC